MNRYSKEWLDQMDSLDDPERIWTVQDLDGVIYRAPKKYQISLQQHTRLQLTIQAKLYLEALYQRPY